MVHRRLASTADHRESLLRNLVTNVLEHESITTTHAKAKEAQTAVERVITQAKHLHAQRGVLMREQVMRYAQLVQNRFYKPKELFPKLMGELTARYANFQGGYTRILKLEPRLGDNAPQSILELVDGKRDMHFTLTAKAVARAAALGEPLNPYTVMNMKKVTRNEARKQEFEAEVEKMKQMYFSNIQQGQATVTEVVRGKKKAPVERRRNPLA